MCAKKAASTTKIKPTASAGRKQSANGKAAAPSALPTPPAAERTLSPTVIGEVAGEIWQLLANRDGQTLAAIKKSIPAPGDVVVAAVGWLAREGKLEFAASGRTLKISLKP